MNDETTPPQPEQPSQQPPHWQPVESQPAQPQYAQPQVAPSQVEQPQPVQPQYAQPEFAQPHHAPATGAASDAAPAVTTRKRPWLVPVIVGGSVVVIGAILAAVVFLVLPSSASSEKPAAPAPTEDVKESPSEDKPESPEGEHVRQEFSPSDPQLEGTGPVADRLQLFSDSYLAKFDDGSLWQLMPQTVENQGAYIAFQFLLSDMKSATRFGTTEEDELYYSQRARYLEARLLAQEPLGTSVVNKLADGKTFSYDGDTGEVRLE